MPESELINLKKLQITSWIYLFVMVVGSGLVFSVQFAASVLAGGIISIISFWISSSDVVTMITTLTETSDPELQKEKAKKSKSGYLLKFWVRIAIIGVVLLVFIKSGYVNIFGLILGLSTVVFTITLTAVGVARHYFFSGRR
ncbi:MAG: ATP synthase subunit I [Desulfotalea sp.]